MDVEVTQEDRDRWILDGLGFQVGALATVAGEYAAEYPEQVRIIGIAKRRGKIDITIADLNGSNPTDGFTINDLNPAPRHRSTAHATGFAEGVERAAEAVLSLQAPHGETPILAAWIRSYIAQAIRALKPSPDPAKEGGDE